MSPSRSRLGRRVGARVPAWWRGAVGYEIYLRSFADGDGDGVGDLRGARGRLEYLRWLGIDVIWITPFYPSPMADHGYDVADHRGVDPLYGTLADFDALVSRAHELGLRVMIDIVPNHTSSQHPWFRAALADPAGPQRRRYHWAPPGPDGGPPNNWVSYFGGPAWTRDPTSGEYWLHLFHPDQPDLNWDEPAVRAEFEAILEFWLARGVDGVRVDVAHGLLKDPGRRDNPRIADPDPAGGARAEFASFAHLHDTDQPGTPDLFRPWRAVADRHDAVLVGEVYLGTPAAMARYVAGGQGLHSCFSFALMWSDWSAATLRATLQETAATAGRAISWVQSSHDDPRPATRFGGGEIGRRRALALSTVLAGLPGAMFLFQGEELGLTDGVVAADRALDPMARPGDSGAGRDGARTPMPWRPVPGLGFTAPGTRPWLPEGGRVGADTVARQHRDPGSFLNRMRRLLEIRRLIDPDASLEWLAAAGEDDPLIGYRRGDILVVANAGDRALDLESLAGGGLILFRTDARGEIRQDLTLDPAQAVILRLPE